METAANQLRTPDLPIEPTTSEEGGNNTPAYQPAPPAPQGQQQDDEQRAEPVQWRDTKREEIFARAKEKRAVETQPFSGDPNDPAALYGANADQGEMGELEQEALRRRQEHFTQIAGQQPQQPQQGQQPARKPLNGLDPELLSRPVPIIVDGQQIEVPFEELVRNYQIDQAATKRLEQAKQLLAQTQEFQRVNQPQPGIPAGYEEPTEQESSTNAQDDLEDASRYTGRKPANVKDLVEKIQLGTPEEAATALEEFVSSAMNRSAPVDETTRVLSALEDANAKQAITAFAEQNPQIATNPILQQEATKEIHRNMALDLINAGYTVEQLRKVAPSPEDLTQLHKQARINRVRGVRSVLDLVTAGYHGALTNLRQLVDTTAPRSTPNQAQSMQQRQQRKESLQPQPVARRLSTGTPATSPARSQEQSRAAAVARMRQARGQPV